MDIDKIITDRIIEKLENGVIAWERGWSQTTPCNHFSGREYNGVNLLLLTPDENGVNRYASYAKWQEEGYQVKKGAKGSLCVFSTKIADKKDETKTFFLRKYYTAFSPSQLEEFDFTPYTPVPLEESEVSIICDGFSSSLIERLGLQHSVGDPAYSSTTDTIYLPVTFTKAEHALSITAHELAHATGHHTRLNRKLGNGFGSADYAYEELIAELSAAFTCGQFGIANVLDNSSAYIASWLKALRNDKTLISRAASKASEVTHYLFDILDGEITSEQYAIE